MENTPHSKEDWARLLKKEWENRARSPFCHFFINSHPAWENAEQWEQQSRMHTEFLLVDLEPEALKEYEVLEIGCGVGRLVPHLRPLVRGYTGFDISASMIREAREHFGDLSGVRFFESDGLSVPSKVQDRSYQLAFALAVFIHCPREVIAPMIQESYNLLAPGGEFRLQLLANPEDPTGVETPALAEMIHEELESNEAGAPPGAMHFIEDRYYMGTRFTMEEATALLKELTDGRIIIRRFDLCHIYAKITRG